MAEAVGNSDFKEYFGKWNMITGKIKPMKYEHPKIKKKRFNFAMYTEHGIYVETYNHHDLMTITSIDKEELKYNIYGPAWNDKVSNRIHHYGKPVFCGDKIVASYSGGSQSTDEYFPTKFLVFDLKGNYLKTLETGYMITDFCYDKDNNRIIMILNDVMQFGYIDMKGLLS